MKRSLPLIALAALFLIPLAAADVLMPPLYYIYGASIMLLFIPIILIEGMAANFLIKKFFKFKISILYLLLALLIANVFSSAVGLSISLSIPIFDIPSVIISAYLITSIIESPVLYLFIRRKTPDKKSKDKTIDDIITSLKISFFANIFSYLLILAFMLAFVNY